MGSSPIIATPELCIEEAAALGELKLLKWLKEAGCPFDDFGNAACSGRRPFRKLEMVARGRVPFLFFRMEYDSMRR